MPSTRWRTTAPLSWRHWDEHDDEWVVFNPASGHLHLLNEAAAHVLVSIERAPRAADDLAADAIPDLVADRDTLDTLLGSLDRLGLIEPEGS